ncbi:OLC1v1024549C1 [Oldenlandia corymbosa var. corymbosa]|uniref:Reticulon-like protein n=1 Tax=Oldenlandia corymbosa var. corymbosa TaxID=529605 RepID=A0AAV1C401_OLDCO|nr:OLC1v1024549C1 [Oldenlandia corymbosa var. corymbosa]
MPEGISAEDLVNNIMDTLSDGMSRQKSGSFFEDQSSSVSSQFNRLFGRQKPVHHILGGGKSADVLLWRNKKISAGVLAGAAAVWVLFEWLNYHFLSLICFALIFGMIAQFVLSNASGLLNRSRSEVPRLVIPEDLFINVAKTASLQVNHFLAYLQGVACGRDFKQFLLVLMSLFAVAIISSWCNFMTILFLGFVAAHTLPVLYERYEDQVDGFIYSVLRQLQGHYRKLDTGFLRKIPTRKFMGKKSD